MGSKCETNICHEEESAEEIVIDATDVFELCCQHSSDKKKRQVDLMTEI